MPSPTYSDGTISIDNGSASLSGDGTAWSTQVKPGDLVMATPAAAAMFPIGIVNVVGGDAAITLDDAYQGTTLTDHDYRIVRGYAWWSGAAPNETLITFLTELGPLGLVGVSSGVPDPDEGRENELRFDLTSGIGYQKIAGSWIARSSAFSFDTFGLAADLGDFDDELNGYTYFATDLGGFYVKLSDASADWSGLVSIRGAVGGAIAVPYTFSTTTTDSDPGAGVLRLNQATQNTATVIRADLLDASGATRTTLLDSLDDSTSVVKGHLRLFKADNPAAYLLFTLASIASPSGYRNITVALVDGSGASPFANGDRIVLAFSRTGDTPDMAAVIHAATGKTIPVDADELGLADSAASFVLKKLTWANLKATAFASPVLTGNPTAPTQSAGDNSTKLATTAYADAAAAAIIAASDAMVFKGVIDCSTNPNYPAADRGHTYRVSVAGKIGGASGVNVEAGDLVICLTDSTASGNQATVGSAWAIAQTNLDGAVIGPANATDGYPAVFDGATGKLLKQVTFAAFKASLAIATGDVSGLPAYVGSFAGIRSKYITGSPDIFAGTRVLPSLDYIAIPDVAPGFSFSRASSAYRVNQFGLLESVSTDVLRQCYDPTTGNYWGWLLEGARSNLALQSEDLTTSWSFARASASANAAVAPNGATTADKLVEDGTASSTHYTFQSIAFTSGSRYTLSRWAKPAGRSTLAIEFPTAQFGAQVRGTFTLSGAGTAVLTTAGTNSSVKITAYPNGWYRCELTADATATSSGNVVFLLHNGTSVTYSGDGTSGVYLWGVQCEVSAGASSYIMTTTATVTRAADVVAAISMTGIFNEIEGTVFVEHRMMFAPTTGSAVAIASLNDGTTSNSMSLRVGPSIRDFQVAASSSLVVDTSNFTLAAGGTRYRDAYRYRLDDFAATVNAASPLTDASGAVPSGITTLTLRLSNEYPACITRLAYFPRGLSDADLQAITPAPAF